MPRFGEPPFSSILLSTPDDFFPTRRSSKDHLRHRKKVQEAIKGDLANIVGNEDIITSDGKNIIRVPVKTLHLPRIIFDTDEGGIGQGSGETEVGKSLGPRQDDDDPATSRAGDQPGIDYYEAELSVDDLMQLVFKDLGLPNLENRGARDITSEDIKFDDIRKKGPMGNLDRRRTIFENLKRNAQDGNPHFGGITEDDLRFKTYDPEIKPETQAAVIAMRDVSGSMGEFEKYITRAFYFWMVRFLRTQYQGVEIRFITHHTEAKEVAEREFFGLGESGGTLVSPAYQLCLDIAKRDYPPSDWNVYAFHFSDGDNWGEVDNQRCTDLVKEGLPFYNMFGYAEIQDEWRREAYERWGSRSETLMNAMGVFEDEPKVVSTVINGRDGIYPALQTFFPGEKKLQKVS